jgi:hypothetical protein
MMDKHFNTFIIVLTIIFALSYVLVGYLFQWKGLAWKA